MNKLLGLLLFDTVMELVINFLKGKKKSLKPAKKTEKKLQTSLLLSVEILIVCHPRSRERTVIELVTCHAWQDVKFKSFSCWLRGSAKIAY